MKSYTLYIKGMHCKACEILINERAQEIEDVIYAKSDNVSGELVLKTKGTIITNKIVGELNKKIKSLGYSASINKLQDKVIYRTLITPFTIAITIFSFFILLQKSGILTLYSPNNISLFAVFIIGIVASLSSCMAVVGGLVLSLSATFAKNDKKDSIIPLALFHTSRIISFFIFGGVIGILGSLFKISLTGNLIMTILLFFVMFVLGMNMLDTFPFFKKLQVSLPYVKIFNTSNNNILTPVMLGALTFILPCGFTQSMQFYALSSGSFITGAITMLIFSLGTLPVLSALSFASVKFSQGKNAPTFFKTMGFLVIFFALMNLISALSLAGVIDPILGF